MHELCKFKRTIAAAATENKTKKSELQMTIKITMRDSSRNVCRFVLSVAVFCRFKIRCLFFSTIFFLVCSGFDFWWVSISVSAVIAGNVRTIVCGRVWNGAAAGFSCVCVYVSVDTIFKTIRPRRQVTHKKVFEIQCDNLVYINEWQSLSLLLCLRTRSWMCVYILLFISYSPSRSRSLFLIRSLI